MSSAKREGASAEDRLDAVFHALGDRTRRALLARLARNPAMITELAQPFAMSLPAVSRHIRVLEGAGLLVRDIDGRMHRCSLNAKPFKTIERWLNHYRKYWEGNLQSLAQFVESTSDSDPH
jgi:DNA-binding transcriptional ArsR family regulator